MDEFEDSPRDGFGLDLELVLVLVLTLDRDRDRDICICMYTVYCILYTVLYYYCNYRKHDFTALI